MVKIREKQTEQLEKAASKGLKLGGWKKMTLSSKIAAVVLVLVALTAILAPLLAPYSPVEIFTARQAPGNGFIFGTDDKGRDILSRMLYGGRYSLIIGFGATAMALVCGSVVGALAAVSRKAVSETIMRILDIIMSIPGIALAAVFVSILGNSVPSIIFAIGFMYTPQIARIVRANIVSEYGEDYVRAVIVSGAKAPWILIKHVLRNCIAPIMVFTVTLVADAIIFEASLTFIGAGIQEPTATWGNILADARGGVLAGRWWQALFPGLAIMITCLALNILSEGITDAMAAAPPPPWIRPIPPSVARPTCWSPTPFAPTRSRPSPSPLALAPCAMSSSSVTIAMCPTSLSNRFSRSVTSAFSLSITVISTSSTMSTLTSVLVRPWAWWASPVAVSPSPRWPSWA